MAYEPTEWKSGDVVTSAKLNNMERGIASGGVLVVTDTDGTLDKTWQEIHDAAFSVIKDVSEDEVNDLGFIPIIGIYCDPDQNYYSVSFKTFEMGDARVYTTTSANGYPVFETESPQK